MARQFSSSSPAMSGSFGGVSGMDYAKPRPMPMGQPEFPKFTDDDLAYQKEQQDFFDKAMISPAVRGYAPAGWKPNQRQPMGQPENLPSMHGKTGGGLMASPPTQGEPWDFPRETGGINGRPAKMGEVDPETGLTWGGSPIVDGPGWYDANKGRPPGPLGNPGGPQPQQGGGQRPTGHSQNSSVDDQVMRLYGPEGFKAWKTGGSEALIKFRQQMQTIGGQQRPQQQPPTPVKPGGGPQRPPFWPADKPLPPGMQYGFGGPNSGVIMPTHSPDGYPINSSVGPQRPPNSMGPSIRPPTRPPGVPEGAVQNQNGGWDINGGAQPVFRPGMPTNGASWGPDGQQYFRRSDIRLKSKIVRIGTHPLGIGVYDYDIDGHRETGVMAQELIHVMPSAVAMGSDGYFRVDYSMI